jgi:putative ABC transport system permease protein
VQLEQIERRLAALPGASAVSVSSGLPGTTAGLGAAHIVLEGRDLRESDNAFANIGSVTSGFFTTLGIPLEQGRVFNTADRAGTPSVAIVTRHFARAYFGNRNPLGQRVQVRQGGADSLRAPTWITIVGIVPDVWGGDPEDPRPAVLFRPLAQAPTHQLALAVRTRGNPLALTKPVRDAMRAVNQDAPFQSPMTLAAAIAEPLWFVRLFGTMFMIFGVVALFLGMIGLYAVTSFATARRMREMGIRMALGAQRLAIIRMVLGQGAAQLGLGVIGGLALAALAMPLLSALLVGVEPRDPVVFGTVATALFGSGILACLSPARRAMRADPMMVLRQE